MATGSQVLTTYYAKRIIGDDAAATAASALLQTGGRLFPSSGTQDTWIFYDTYLGPDIYGIKYESGISRYLRIQGDGTDGVYINMDTGNTYIRGKVGINYDPETSQNDYKLRVSGNTYHNGDVYFGGANDLGIYYEGTNTISRVIRFIDNIDSDGWNGISVGYGGLTILGSGESTNTVINGLSLTGGAETTYITSDNNILLYPGQNSAYDSSALVTVSPSRLIAGVINDTTREAQVGCQSGAGNVLLWSAASATGNRGLWFGAHGTATSGINVISVDQNNASITVRADDVWGNKVRMYSNILRFYSAVRDTTTSYGYIQTDENRMKFRKENGVDTYGFDFNSHIYTTGSLYVRNNSPALYLSCQDLTNLNAADNGLSSDRNARGVAFYTKDHATWLGEFGQGYVKSSGQIWGRFYVRNHKTDGTEVNNYIYLYANKAGTATYAVASPANFRSAISAKGTQDAVSVTGTSGITFVHSISQNAQGVVSASTSTVRSASASQSGIVTTGAQIFAGVKTFSSTISGSIDGNAGTATKLQTARSLWGNSFDGSAALSGSMIFKHATVNIGTSSNNGNTGSSTLYRGLSFQDKNDYMYGELYAAADTDGRIRIYLNSRNKKTDGTAVSNALVIGVNKDGTYYYAVSSPSAFRSAISVKATQSAVSVAGTSGITFVHSISQNAQGVVSASTSTVRSASTSQSGIVTTGTQSFAGNKTFTGGITANGNIWSDHGTSSEADCGVTAGGGSCYVFSHASSTGQCGLWSGKHGNLISVNNGHDITIGYNSNASRGQIHLWGSSSGTITFVNGSGNVAFQNDRNLVVYDTNGNWKWQTNTGTSTYLVKDKIIPITEQEVEKLRKINTISFYYKPELKCADTSKHYGMIAEEVLPLFPEMVDIPEDYNPEKFDLSKGILQPLPGIKYDRFIPLLIRAMQIQADEIDELKKQIKKLSTT